MSFPDLYVLGSRFWGSYVNREGLGSCIQYRTSSGCVRVDECGPHSPSKKIPVTALRARDKWDPYCGIAHARCEHDKSEGGQQSAPGQKPHFCICTGRLRIRRVAANYFLLSRRINKRRLSNLYQLPVDTLLFVGQSLERGLHGNHGNETSGKPQALGPQAAMYMFVQEEKSTKLTLF